MRITFCRFTTNRAIGITYGCHFKSLCIYLYELSLVICFKRGGI